MFEYKRKMRRDEAALESAKLLAEERKAAVKRHYEEKKSLLDECYSLTDMNFNLAMKYSSLKSMINNESWKKEILIQEEYYSAYKEYQEKQGERSHRQSVIFASITTFYCQTEREKYPWVFPSECRQSKV